MLARGEIGLGQRFVEATGKLWRENKLKGLSSVEIGRMLSSTAVADFKSTRLDQVDYGALVALPRERPQLIEFSHGLFQPEVKSEANWYVSIGSGQTVADPLLGFVRKTFWGDERPTKSEGIFAAAMVLTLACEMAPSGVALPIRMAVLGSDKKARELTDDELQEHREHVDGALQHFKAYRDSPPSDQPLPTAPKKTQ